MFGRAGAATTLVVLLLICSAPEVESAASHGGGWALSEPSHDGAAPTASGGSSIAASSPFAFPLVVAVAGAIWWLVVYSPGHQRVGSAGDVAGGAQRKRVNTGSAERGQAGSGGGGGGGGGGNARAKTKAAKAKVKASRRRKGRHAVTPPPVTAPPVEAASSGSSSSDEEEADPAAGSSSGSSDPHPRSNAQSPVLAAAITERGTPCTAVAAAATADVDRGQLTSVRKQQQQQQQHRKRHCELSESAAARAPSPSSPKSPLSLAPMPGSTAASIEKLSPFSDFYRGAESPGTESDSWQDIIDAGHCEGIDWEAVRRASQQARKHRKHRDSSSLSNSFEFGSNSSIADDAADTASSDIDVGTSTALRGGGSAEPVEPAKSPLSSATVTPLPRADAQGSLHRAAAAAAAALSGGGGTMMAPGL